MDNDYNTEPLTDGDIGLCDLQLKPYLVDVTKRGRPCRKYNCHGMTFAARRSALYDSVIPNMLQDDDYYEIKDTKDVLPGDVIIYWRPSPLGVGNVVDHSGIVIEVGFVGSVFSPKIVSKWGGCYELLHNLYVGDYGKIHTYHRVRT